MKLVITLVSILLINLCWSQGRVDIPGSRISVVPPVGSEIPKFCSVLTKQNSFEMTLLEFPGENMEEKFNEIDSSNYIDMGIHVYGQSELKIDGYNARLIHANSDALVDIVQLIFGDSTFFVMGSTLFSRGDTEMYNQIVQAYQSIKIDEKKTVNWDEFLAFKPDVKNTYQLVKDGCFPLKLTFTKNGVRNDKPGKEPFLICQQVPNKGIYKDLDEFLSNSMVPFLTPGLEILEIISEKEIERGDRVFNLVQVNCKQGEDLFRLFFFGTLSDDLGVFITAKIYNPDDFGEIESFLMDLRFKN